MRLLNTRTLQFYETYEPPSSYAILSHRWQDEEVSYEDFDLTLQPPHLIPPWLAPKREATMQRQGYQKICNFAQLAEDCGFEWCWVDTCCIDKRSSAELSEAINSMWTWYKCASLCFVYLSDVVSGSNAKVREDVLASAWFERCWTLQELLAPRVLTFYTSTWDPILALDKGATLLATWLLGKEVDRDGDDVAITPEHTMDLLAKATRIPVDCLGRFGGYQNYCVAAKMSWAARRKATRIEDEAYSLLGLFEINMPLLYGEGRRSFNRLQQEILRTSSDESIFAWRTPCRGSSPGQRACLSDCSIKTILAPSPAYFSSSGDISRLHNHRDIHDDGHSAASPLVFRATPAAPSITNRGLAITDQQAFLARTPRKRSLNGTADQAELPEVYYIKLLRCYNKRRKARCAIVLRPTRADILQAPSKPPLSPSDLHRHLDSPVSIRERAQSCHMHFSHPTNDEHEEWKLEFGVQQVDTVLYVPIGQSWKFETQDSVRSSTHRV